MRKTLTIVFGVIVVVTIGLTISPLASAQPPKFISIWFFPLQCDDEEEAAQWAQETYHVQKGGQVVFVNSSNVDIVITLEDCNIFAGDPSTIPVERGQSSRPYPVKLEAQECQLDVEPDCEEEEEYEPLAGPIIIPEEYSLSTSIRADRPPTVWRAAWRSVTAAGRASPPVPPPTPLRPHRCRRNARRDGDLQREVLALIR
jgi:hypothetical protein